VRRFLLQRDIDVSGVSGVGIVADGVMFNNGKCCLQWRGEYRSIAIWRNSTELVAVHGHDGATRLVWLDS
jgi:hypothetical protein